MHQPQLPGMPRWGIWEVSANFRLWGDRIATGYIVVATGPSLEELDEQIVQCSTDYRPQQVNQLIDGLRLSFGHVARRVSEDRCPDVVGIVAEAVNLYGHLL